MIIVIKKIKSIQEWNPINEIFDNGIFRINSEYLKLIKINPINYNLKSDIEKESILNSYKIFLKTCDFDMQILIQSKKENLLGHINKIKKNIKENRIEISKNYINYIQKINKDKKSLSKVFYIVIKEEINTNNEKMLSERIIKENLKEKYFKIKECLARCGNYVEEIKDKKETIQTLSSFFYVKNYLNKLEKKEE